MDIYKMVTDRIIEQLEQGVIPWKKPWVGGSEGAFNRISRNSYSLCNQLLLRHDGEYATFRQWQEMGGHVKKGAKAEMIVFWKLQEKKEEEDGEEKIKKIPVLRYYNVFHISQVENVCPLKPEITFNTDPIDAAEQVLQNYVKRENISLLSERGNRACYMPATDEIMLPDLAQFEKAEEYYSTAFHECAHSTMTAERCDRKNEHKKLKFGNEEYSREELVAEITSAAVLHRIGIETQDTFQNSCSYIQSWLQVLKNDKKCIVSAAGKAEKATEYILKDAALPSIK